MPQSARKTLHNELSWLITHSRPRKLRTMREFAEQEIVIPSGPYEGLKFRCSRQPFTGAWFDAVDSGLWNRYLATGPTQSGKSLSCFVIPILYHLFEVQETVICGLPDMDMAADKWRVDFLPVIERSRFKEMLPTHGAGGRGARVVEAMQFRNGPTLKFMSGGGSDKSRAGFTSRVVAVTEIDGMDSPGGRSRESDKVTQLEARTRAFGNNKRVYLECTVSNEEGRTWQEYIKGTHSRLVMPCPQCKAWVAPEREHLTGWQGADSEVSAKATGAFSCPACGLVWSEEERRKANASLKIIHNGQAITSAGDVEGDLPKTQTLGFRWSAVHNLFTTGGDLAAEEWKAGRSADEENAERAQRQFVWAIPVVPTKLDESKILSHELVRRIIPLPKGIVPKDAKHFSAGIDLGKHLAHWIVVAWSEGGTGHIVDYGRIEVASDSLGVEQAIMVALREFRGMVLEGWPIEARSEPAQVQHVCVDAGYMTNIVYAFAKESGDRFKATLGRGVSQQREQWAQRTTQTGSVVQGVGEGSHACWLSAEQLQIYIADADYWKTWVHQRLAAPMGKPGAMTLFQATPQEHLTLAKHLTAEQRTEEFIKGKGMVTRWERKHRYNHYFDALYLACLAGHALGVRLIDPAIPAPPPQPDSTPSINVAEWIKGRKRW